MKNVVLVFVAILFLLPNVAVASLPLEQRPTLAVFVSGHGDPNVNRFLATELTRALVRTERYREASRYEEFLLFIESWQLAENRMVEVARDYDIQQIAITSMRSMLGSYIITAKIVNTETGETTVSGELDNSLATLADIRTVSAELVGAMFGIAASESATQAIVDVAPTPTPRERQFMPQRANVINTDAVDHFFAPKWLPTTDGLGGFNLEYGQIRGDGWMWSIDGGRTNLADRYPHTWNITANIGDIWTFANNMHFAYGGSVGFGEQADRDNKDAVYFGPFVRWSWRQYIELTYRGLIGETYINQAMLGLNIRTNNRHSQHWQSRERSSHWKNHWIYMGGSLGVGGRNKPSGLDVGDFAATFIVDFPLLAPVISLETGVILGNKIYGVYPMGRIGFITEVFEATFDVGYVLGSMSSMLGSTVGLKIYSGMLFCRYIFAEGIDDDWNVSHTFSAGYKVGVGRSRVGNQ